MREIIKAVLEEQNLKIELDEMLTDQMKKVILIWNFKIRKALFMFKVYVCTLGTLFCGINCNNLFELQLEEAQEMKNNELIQQMMNIYGQIKKVGHVHFCLFFGADTGRVLVLHNDGRAKQANLVDNMQEVQRVSLRPFV
jgi:hypothetical protein